MERCALAWCGLLACWCGVAAAHSLWSGGVVPRRSRNAATILLLVRALLCGVAVAWCGWSLAVGRPHVGLMAAMQASACVAAWGACATRLFEARGKSSPDADGSPGGGGGRVRGGSHTLPRGWRFHHSTGLFEHKRSGRLQREPPATCETGSPLHADLPPCDEEEALLVEEDVRRLGRSRTWSSGTVLGRQSSGEAEEHRLNVWELREALGARPRLHV